MRLSSRAKELLLIIDKATDKDNTGKIERYYVPHSRDGVSGAGDARCLASLESKGLIKHMPLSRYSYAITENGRLISQTIPEKTR